MKEIFDSLNEDEKIEFVYEQTLLNNDILNLNFDESLNESDKVIQEGVLDPLFNWFTGWFGYFKNAILAGSAVLVIAKLIALAMKKGASMLDKNIEIKQKYIDMITDKVFEETQAENIKMIAQKIQNGEIITEEDVEELERATEKLNDELREKLNSGFEQGKKEKIAKALLMASKAIESQIGMIGSFLGGLYIFTSLAHTPGNSPEEIQDKLERKESKFAENQANTGSIDTGIRNPSRYAAMY